MTPPDPGLLSYALRLVPVFEAISLLNTLGLCVIGVYLFLKEAL